MFKFLARTDDKFLEAFRDPGKRDQLLHSLEQTRFWAFLSALLMFVLLTLVWSVLFIQRFGRPEPGLDRGLALLMFVFVMSLLNAVNATNNLRLLRAHWLGRNHVKDDFERLPE